MKYIYFLLVVLIFCPACISNKSDSKFARFKAFDEVKSEEVQSEPIKELSEIKTDYLTINTNTVNVTADVVNVSGPVQQEKEQEQEEVKQDPIQNGIVYTTYTEAYNKYRTTPGKHFYVLVTADWCAPCAVLKQKLQELNPNVEIAVVDYDSISVESRRIFWPNGERPVIPYFARWTAQETPGSFRVLKCPNINQPEDFVK